MKDNGENIMSKITIENQILDAALELFSEYGIEATSIAMISQKMKCSRSTVYAHFKSRDEIVDALFDRIIADYEANSITTIDLNTIPATAEEFKIEEYVKSAQGQFRYIIHDDDVCKVRRLMTVEQFRNKKIADIKSKYTFDGVVEFHAGLFKKLMESGVLAEDDPKLLAYEYCLPIHMWIEMVDRDPEREQEALDLAKRHVIHFFETYKRK